MRKAGVTNYKEFAVKAIAAIPDLPISFEVFSDDLKTMEREAREIASWGGNTSVIILTGSTPVSAIRPAKTETIARALGSIAAATSRT